MWHVCLCMWVCTYVCKIWGRMWRLALLMPDKCNTYVDVYAMYKYKKIIFYIKVRHMYNVYAMLRHFLWSEQEYLTAQYVCVVDKKKIMPYGSEIVTSFIDLL